MPELKPRRSAFVEQLMQPKYEPEVEDANDAFEEARTRSRDATMLDLRFVNGSIVSFAYAYLTRVNYEPGDTIDMRFGRDEVRVTGKNLGRLRETISEHRTRYIQEGADGEDGLKPGHATHVDKIHITEGEDA